MKFSRKTLWIAILFSSILIFACVTINIYFPAEKVEAVAGEIVDEIRGKKDIDKGKSMKKEKSSLLREKTVLALTISYAWAEEVTSVSNPTIRALKGRMKARYVQMKPYYQKGVLIENDNGYVSLGKPKGLSLKKKRDLKNLIDAENKDRQILYKEVSKALKIDPSQTNKVAEIFAKEWKKPVR